MRFDDFIGNERVKEQLLMLAESGRLPHAIIIEGEEGVGKRTLARELALNLLCRGDDAPCRVCPQCKKVIKGIHPDVYEYTAPARAAAFHVNKVREIRDDAFVQPNEADYKIYILGNAGSMTANAQNALLKVLEEPPSYVLFILTTVSKSLLLETVLSRSVVISLEGVEPAAAAEYICKRNESVDYQQALKAAEIFNGNIGRALESLEEGKLAGVSKAAEGVALALLEDDEYELIKACSVFEKDRELLSASLMLLRSMFRDALIDNTDSMSGQRETVEKLRTRLNSAKLLRLVGVSDGIRRLTEKNGNNAILITKLCYDLRRAVGR